MSHIDANVNDLNADDLIEAVAAALTAAQSTGCTQYLTITVSAENATTTALKESTEVAHLAAIKAHNEAWKMYRTAAENTRLNQDNTYVIEALREHERAIYIHQALHARFVRVRHGVT